MEQTYYSKWDSAYGVISSHCGNQTYIILDNDQTAYTYSARHLKCGTPVIVSIVQNGDYMHYAKCVVDSICDDFGYEAVGLGYDDFRFRFGREVTSADYEAA